MKSITGKFRVQYSALRPGVVNLIGMRAVRSLAEGFLAVVYPLYLLRIGIHPVTVGILFTVTGIASAGMTLAVGLFADRWGRKPFAMAFAGFTVLAGAIFLLTRTFWILGLASILGGFGRGGMGAGGAQGGPFAPALQALLAEKAGNAQRPQAFALMSGVGSYAAALGALISGLAQWLATPTHPFFGYQVLFAITLLSGVAMLLMTVSVTESPPAPTPASRVVLSPQGWHAVVRLSLAGAFNGMGMGFMVGFLPIWFHLRFGVGPAAVGVMMALTCLLAGPGFLLATRLARYLGSIRTITLCRGVAPLLFALLPFMPTMISAAVVFIAALLITSAVIPVRQSFAMGVVSESERAAAVGIRATAARLPSSISPTLTGYLLSSGDLALPFWGMAVCMGISALLYYLFFRNHDSAQNSQPSLAG